MSETPDPEVIELASKVFDLARTGDAETLAAYVDAGVPADLTNDRGDSLRHARRLPRARGGGHRTAGPGRRLDRANDRGQTLLAGAVFKGEDAVVRALLAGGANPEAGTPSAVDTARMFGKTELLELFDAR